MHSPEGRTWLRWLLLFLLFTACGSQSASLFPPEKDAGTGADAGTGTDAGASVSPADAGSHDGVQGDGDAGGQPLPGLDASLAPLDAGEGDGGGALPADAAVLDAGANGGRLDAGGSQDAGQPPWTPPEPPRREPPGCAGLAAECAQRSGATCQSQEGCRVTGECRGTANSCSIATRFQCGELEGCDWNAVTSRCEGVPRRCSTYSGSGSCSRQTGCFWRSECVGNAVECQDMVPEQCAGQAGCGLTCSDGLVMCDADCVDLEDDEAHCGACDFECGPHGSCDRGACSCAAPYTVCDGRCVDTDSDGNHCGACGIQCQSGFSCQNGRCTDVDECATPAGCLNGRACTNRPGGFSCGPCPMGWEAFGPRACIDIDECATNNGGCGRGTLCHNYAGGHYCGACSPGYESQGDVGCIDIDECARDQAACDPRTTCTNLPGSYACGPCPSGFDGTGQSGCTDLDECAVNNGGCDHRTLCTNTVGARTCGACPPGFVGDGERGCIDVDECLVDNGGCAPERACVNTPGGMQCGACPAGYQAAGDRACVDIDECSTGTSWCSPVRVCVNQPGSYDCGACPAGYVEDGALLCADIDECAIDDGGCDPHTECQNYPGSRSCSACPAGFTGTGETGCVDIDECATPGACDALTTCTNTEGAFQCSACPAGHTLVGRVCQPRLLGFEVASPARLTPALDDLTRNYALDWSVGSTDRRVRLRVGQGVRIQVGREEVTPDQWFDWSPLGSIVTLTSPNGQTTRLQFSTGLACPIAGMGKITGDRELAQLGTAMTVDDSGLFAALNSSDSDRIAHAPRSSEAFASPTIIVSGPSEENAWGPFPVVRWNDWLVVGYPYAEALPPNAFFDYLPGIEFGRVRMYAATPPYDLLKELPAPVGASRFGAQLAQSGDLLAVGGKTGIEESAVSILRRSRFTFSVEAVLPPPTAGFGSVLAWMGDHLAVSDLSRVYVYEKVAGAWTQTRTLESPEPLAPFAESLLYDERDDTLYVGSPSARAGRGEVTLYRRVTQPTPDLPLPLAAPVRTNVYGFGRSMAVTNHVLYVAASQGSSQDRRPVNLYGFASEPGWAIRLCGERAGAPGSAFGSTMIADGDRVLVGAPWERDPTLGYAGAIYQFVPGAYNLLP